MAAGAARVQPYQMLCSFANLLLYFAIAFHLVEIHASHILYNVTQIRGPVGRVMRLRPSPISSCAISLQGRQA